MATIKDVAKRAGVSISTVSNVLNSSKYVSDELTQKVQAAIADLHYRVDVTARNMKIRNTKMIGVIVSSFHIIFVPQVIKNTLLSMATRSYFIPRIPALKKKSTAFLSYWIIRWTVLF